MKTVIVELKVKLVVKLNNSEDVEQIVNEMDTSFSDTTGLGDIQDSEILDFEVTESK